MRGHVDRNPGAKVGHGILPENLAGSRVQGNYHIIEAAIDHLICSGDGARDKNDAAVIAPTADRNLIQRRHFARHLDWLVRPLLLACGCIQGEYIIMAIGDVHRAVDYDGRRLQLGLVIEYLRVKYPSDLEIGNVAGIDLIDILESGVGQVVAIVQPVKRGDRRCLRGRRPSQ